MTTKLQLEAINGAQLAANTICRAQLPIMPGILIKSRAARSQLRRFSNSCITSSANEGDLCFDCFSIGGAVMIQVIIVYGYMDYRMIEDGRPFSQAADRQGGF